ncbi:MAG: LLM class flavin-dependent oxidoreductase [Ilumatobacteraceae bacterium]
MIPLSVLDLSVVRHGGSSAEALADTARLARHADQLGFRRFWVAEHHNMVSVASTTPSVLIAHLASVTRHIRVGSGGVMLPNHTPVAVAEQFALLEALHPGRIDLGIGRAPGADPATAAAFGRDPHLSVERFPRDLLEVMALLGDRRGEGGGLEHFRATPAPTSFPVVALLGSSGYSAQLAGMLGLPFAYAHHFDTGYTDLASQLYLDHFRPSAVLTEPHLIVGAGALAADTDDEAERIGLPSRILRLGIRTNRRHPLLSPDEASVHPDADAARRMPTEQLIGSTERVVEGLRELVRRTGAAELMLTSATFDVEDRVRSLTLIDRVWREHSAVG